MPSLLKKALTIGNLKIYIRQMDDLETRFISNKGEPDAQRETAFSMITKQINNRWASSVKLTPELIKVQDFLHLCDAAIVEEKLLLSIGYIFQYHQRRFSELFRKSIEDLPDTDLAHCNQDRVRQSCKNLRSESDPYSNYKKIMIRI